MERRTFLLASVGAILSSRIPSPESSPQATPQTALPDELKDFRDLWVRPWSIDRAFTMSGKVGWIEVAPRRRGYLLNIRGIDGESKEYGYQTIMAVVVDIPNGDKNIVYTGHDNELPGVYEDDNVAFSGRFIGHYTAENAYGVETTVPFIDASTVTKLRTKRK